MQRHMMVTDLPEIQIPDEICEDCLQSKQCWFRCQNTMSQPDIELIRSARQRNFQSRLQECEMASDTNVIDEGEIMHIAFLVESKLVNLEIALKYAKWKYVMREELDSIESNWTLELVSLPNMKKAIGDKWIFKVKLTLMKKWISEFK